MADAFENILGQPQVREFLRATGIPAVPQMVYRPRANPYVFWQKDEIEV